MTLTLQPLPVDADGAIVTSAEFGEAVLVEITYNTNEHGVRVDSEPVLPRTLHGPFADAAEAEKWIQAHPDDSDIDDYYTIPLNLAR